MFTGGKCYAIRNRGASERGSSRFAECKGEIGEAVDNRVYWTVAGFVLLGLAALCAYLGRPFPPEPGIRWENVERIQIGMTRAEVEEVIGLRTYSETGGPDSITKNSPPGFHKVLL